MQRAKAFCFVCAGVFLLALSFHLGATSARGQAGGAGLMIGGEMGQVPVVGTPSGDLWIHNGVQWYVIANIFGGVPDGRTIVSLAPHMAMASNGEVFYGAGSPGNAWVSIGAPPVGPTPATTQTMGQLKVRYR